MLSGVIRLLSLLCHYSVKYSRCVNDWEWNGKSLKILEGILKNLWLQHLFCFELTILKQPFSVRCSSSLLHFSGSIELNTNGRLSIASNQIHWSNQSCSYELYCLPYIPIDNIFSSFLLRYRVYATSSLFLIFVA